MTDEFKAIIKAIELKTFNDDEILKPMEKSVSDIRGIRTDLIAQTFEIMERDNIRNVDFAKLYTDVKIGEPYHNENTAEFHIKRAFQEIALNKIGVKTIDKNGQKISSTELSKLCAKHLIRGKIGAYNKKMRDGSKQRVFNIDFKNMYK